MTREKEVISYPVTDRLIDFANANDGNIVLSGANLGPFQTQEAPKPLENPQHEANNNGTVYLIQKC